MFIDEADPNLVSYPSRAALWAATRMRAFEEPVFLKDPWAQEFGGLVTPTDDFQLHPSELLRRAKHRIPEPEPPSASAFADWVYSLYRRAPSLTGMARGREAEGIWDTPPPYSKSFADINSSLWRLDYCGMGEEGETAEPFLAPTLCVQEAPLRCRPDLVYRHRHSSFAVIVEVKCTNKPLPRSLWPNVWAQLWAYSRIKELSDVQNLVVLAEVWGLFASTLVLRRLVRRDPRRQVFDSFYSELFHIYQDHLSSHSKFL